MSARNGQGMSIVVRDNGVEVLNAPTTAEVSIGMIFGADSRHLAYEDGLIRIGSIKHAVRYRITGVNVDRGVLLLRRDDR